MKQIYIVLTYTGTIPARVIKYHTKHQYSHSSIALDKGLNKMYSFARLNPYIAFIGGFVQEKINRGTFKRFKNTITEIYELQITDEQYKLVESNIAKVREAKCKYNILGLLLVSVNKKVKRQNKFYCSEFIKYILENSNIDVSYLPEIVRPEDFKKIPNLKLIYKGILKEYKCK